MTNELITGETYGEAAAQARTRAFLLEEARKPLSELLASVEQAHAGVMTELQGVSEAQAAFKPGGSDEEGFSINEITRHLAGSGATMAGRFKALGLDEPLPPAAGPGGFGAVGPGAQALLVALFEDVRRQLREAVAAVEGNERLDTLAPHIFFGEQNCRTYLRLTGLHFEDHAQQIARIKAMPGYPKA